MTLHENPTPADYVRSFVTFHRQALLSTVSERHDGFPFGSLVPYDVDDQGRIIISVSQISSHFKNLQQSPKASLLVQQQYFEHQPRSGGRITLLVRFSDLPEEDYEPTAASYRDRYGEDAEFELSHDFVFKRGEIEAVRWISGFARMGWLSPEEYSNGSVDCIAPVGLRAVEHMNTDHRDALVALVHQHAPEMQSAKNEDLRVKMICADSTGISLRYFDEKEAKVLFIPFEPRLVAPEELRSRVVDLVKMARASISSD
jgi:putative heme iron utilization protein